MTPKQKQLVKSTGATFTPSELADFLSSLMLKYLDRPNSNIKVLDPACGEGALLLSIGQKLIEQNIPNQLIGYDSNIEYLDNTRSFINLLGWENTELINEDFLETIVFNKKYISSYTVQTSLFDEVPKNALKPTKNTVDAIIANPPYVRTQHLGAEKAQSLAKRFNLKGRVDLYYPFIIAMTESLKEGGIMGIITSNRYLYTKSGEGIREYLSNNYELLELIDLGDTKLFSAAVLPAILIARKKQNPQKSNASFVKIYETPKGFSGSAVKINNIYDAIRCTDSEYFSLGAKNYKSTKGTLNFEIGSSDAWGMLTNDESVWINKIHNASSHTIGDLFKVKVGVKTTADNVFISDSWDSLGKLKPEPELLKELLSQENISRWSITENNSLKILYPHYSEEGKKHTIKLEKYPLAAEYFKSHEDQLKGRKYVIDAGRNWYEIWVPQKPAMWQLPKLVFPDISLDPRFYFDVSGKIVNGNCYWIAAKNKLEEMDLLFIQGIANTKFMTKYHDLVFNNKLYSGRRRYITQYVEKYPLPKLGTAVYHEIVHVVEALNNTSSISDIMSLEHTLEVLVAQSYGMEPILSIT